MGKIVSSSYGSAPIKFGKAKARASSEKLRSAYPLADLSLRQVGRHSLSVGDEAEEPAGRGATTSPAVLVLI